MKQEENQQPRKYSNLQILGPLENLYGPQRYLLMKKSSTTFQYLQPLMCLKRLHKSQLYCIRKVWSALRRINQTICWTFCSNVVFRYTPDYPWHRSVSLSLDVYRWFCHCCLTLLCNSCNCGGVVSCCPKSPRAGKCKSTPLFDTPSYF